MLGDKCIVMRAQGGATITIRGFYFDQEVEEVFRASGQVSTLMGFDRTESDKKHVSSLLPERAFLLCNGLLFHSDNIQKENTHSHNLKRSRYQ